MKRKSGNSKGVTLIALVITIIILLILASIATYSGIDVINSSKLTAFTTEMKIMQTQVNSLYDQWKNGDIDKDTIGKDLTSSTEVQEQANLVLVEELGFASSISELTGYKYFDQDTIQELGIDGVEQEFFINIEQREVVSYNGLKYEGDMYYTLNQLPNGLYNVDYDPNQADAPTFDVNYEIIGENNYRVTISNIQYDGYIDKWYVKYQEDGADYWNTTEDLSFVVNKSEIYKIYIENGVVKSDYVYKLLGNSKLTRDKDGKISVPREINGMTNYINFDIGNLNNNNITVEPSLPFAINSNGEYDFKVTILDENNVSHTINEKVKVESYVDNPDYWLDLDGTAHIELNNVNQNDFYQEFTIATKIKINREEQQSKMYMGLYGNHYGSEGIARQFTEDTSYLASVDYTNYYDKWTDFVVTYNQSLKQLKIYFNGELKGAFGTNCLPYEGFNIGTSFLLSDRQMIGQMSCLKIWDKELSDEEVLQIDLLEEDINVRKEDSYCNINLKSEDEIKEIGTFVGTGYSFEKP